MIGPRKRGQGADDPLPRQGIPSPFLGSMHVRVRSVLSELSFLGAEILLKQGDAAPGIWMETSCEEPSFVGVAVILKVVNTGKNYITFCYFVKLLWVSDDLLTASLVFSKLFLMAQAERRSWREIVDVRVNPVVRTLCVSDIFILSGFGLIAPIFAVYLTNGIEGGNLQVVGLASTIYFLARALGQLPVAQLIDRFKGEKDDFSAMIIGSIAVSIVPLLYLIARTPGHIYLIQLFYGLSSALTVPSWLAIFTRHIERDKEGQAWASYYTLVSLSGAAVASIGGIVANYMGFAPLFIMVSILSFVGSGWLLFVREEMKRR